MLVFVVLLCSCTGIVCSNPPRSTLPINSAKELGTHDKSALDLSRPLYPPVDRPAFNECSACLKVVGFVESKGCSASCDLLPPGISELCDVLMDLGVCQDIVNWLDDGMTPQTICHKLSYCGGLDCWCGTCSPSRYGRCLSFPNHCPSSSSKMTSSLPQTSDTEVGPCLDGSCDSSSLGCCVTCVAEDTQTQEKCPSCAITYNGIGLTCPDCSFGSVNIPGSCTCSNGDPCTKCEPEPEAPAYSQIVMYEGSYCTTPVLDVSSCQNVNGSVSNSNGQYPVESAGLGTYNGLPAIYFYRFSGCPSQGWLVTWSFPCSNTCYHLDAPPSISLDGGAPVIGAAYLTGESDSTCRDSDLKYELIYNPDFAI